MTGDWLDCIVALLDAGARFIVVGAHALAAHGQPRGTQDLDLFIEPTPENAERVWRGLAAFGAPLDSRGISRADLQDPGTVVQLGVPPNRIDLLTSLSGVRDFEEAWQERFEQDVRGRKVPFLGRATLVRNKRATGRTKDRGDLEALGE